MAGNTVTPDLLKKALEMHCIATGLQCSEGEDKGQKRWLLVPGDTIVQIKDGKLQVDGGEDAPKVKASLAEIIMDLKEEAPTHALIPKQKIDEAKKGSVVEDWRAKQDRTYVVEGGKEVPNTFAASEEANRRKINVETDSGRTETYVWSKARAIDAETGQYREAKVNFEWTTFRQRAAWEIARNMERKIPGIVKGIDEVTLLPILDSSKSFKGQPPGLYLHMQILNRWTFADRDAESKAERRAILKLCNREYRDHEEIEMEQEEVMAVQEARA